MNLARVLIGLPSLVCSTQAAIGFLCMQQTDGHNCVSRRERRVSGDLRCHVLSETPAHPHTPLTWGSYKCVLVFVPRQLQNTYKGTGEAELQETMNRHFGYAHAGGMQDTV